MQNVKTSFQEEYDRIKISRDVISKWLSGAGEEICLDQEPSRRYSIGIITPLSEDETSLEDEKKKWILKRRPNSIGFEARVIPNNHEFKLAITVNLSVYYRSVPTFEEQRASVNLKGKDEDISNDTTNIHFRQKYKRVDVVVEKIPLTIVLPKDKTVNEISCDEVAQEINQHLDSASNTIADSEDCWIDEEKESTIPLSALTSEQSYLSSLPKGEKGKPNWKVKVTAKIWPAENGQWRLGLFLTNATETKNGQHQIALFNTKISCDLHEAIFVSVPFKAASLDYRYNTRSWGKGVNCVLEVSEEGKIAHTETVPVYEQERIVTRSNMETACNFERLSSEAYVDALKEVTDWLESYRREWEEENKSFQGDESYPSREQGLKDFQNEIERFLFGIEALKQDKRLQQSFRLMNEAFSKGKNKSWRLFQLVFIVSQMPSLLARENNEQSYLEELKKVDVLWFPTGGGKTEAYFGVIITAMFYDRLRGKSRGVTAWLRYPLRMLSIQQLQRLVDIVVQADKIRVSSNEPSLVNCDPFSVGYYVGSSNTPNELTLADPVKRKFNLRDPIVEIKERIDGTANINDVRELVLQRCPFCESTNLKVNVDLDHIRIKHSCLNCSQDIPIYISDSEIYRYIPTVIVGTVDRLARAGQTRLFGHLFGGITHKCPEHGYLSFGECVEPVCKIKKYEKLDNLYDPAPSLLLQDELHLLKESLGTYDSHYETFLDLLCRSVGKSLPAKRLAATATIEGYKEHVWELYGRDSVRFPVKGRKENDSAYTQPSQIEKVARFYIGIMPTGANTEETASTILRALKIHSAELAKNGEWSESITNNYDLGLAYVNEKNTAGNIRSRWDEINDIQVLTGDKGLGEVRAVIGRVESDENKQYEDRLKAIVATSVISHGVDLTRLNFMTFCGMPNHASDYIQASSRVGRSHLGIVFTVFRSDNNRERNIYQRFYEYHERLYQLVEPVPINRFSESSIKRTLSGILSSCILNILSHQKGIPFDRAKDFVGALEDGVVTDEQLISLVEESYMINSLNLSGTTANFFSKLINKLVKDQRRIIKDGEKYKTFTTMKPPPVSSLREVNEQVEFTVNFKSGDILEKIRKGRRISNGGID